MKNLRLLFTLFVGLFLLTPNQSFSQEFPWPDLGEAMVIEPGAPGTINETIAEDVNDQGERLHNHYILKRGFTYLYTARITNDGWPLMVTAEEGDGPLPIIKALGPAAGEEEAERIFHAQGDLYIKDLVLNGFDQGGNYTDNATVRLAADEITVVCDNIKFDFNRQNNLRINAKDCELYVQNCIIANQGVAARLWQGFALHFRGNYTPIVHFRNNTIYNMHHTVIDNMDLKKYKKLIFEQNTIVNTGTGGADFGRPEELIVRNNLFVNIGILGDGIIGDRSDFIEPHYYFSIDSNFVDDELVVPKVIFENNHFYSDPDVIKLLPDSSKKATLSMFHPYLESLLGENNVIADEAVNFTNFPTTETQYQNYINDFFTFAEEPAELPAFHEDFRDMDFTYPDSHDAYSAAHDGGPLGDRNWFPGFDKIIIGVKSVGMDSYSVYPNPVNDILHVNLKSDLEVDKVVITNILGQNVSTTRDLSSKVISVYTGNLVSGIYFVNLYRHDKLKGTTKILKR